MADSEKKVVKLKFAKDRPPASDHPTTGKKLARPASLEIGHSEYSRTFEVKKQPFDCEEEEAQFLLGTGYFEVVEENAPAGENEAEAPAKTKAKAKQA
jgi:hypothetical protein